MTTDDTGATKAPRTRKAATTPKTTPPAEATAGSDVLKALKDAAHAVIGFGVIGWNKTQVHRRDLIKDLNSQVHQVETHLDGAKEQLATAIRHFDARIEPVRHDIDSQL